MPSLDAVPRRAAKPLAVRRHVDRKILRLSLSVGAAAAIVTGFLQFASGYPLVQRWKRNNLRALSEISCSAETCDTSEFTGDWQAEEPDYLIDTKTLYLIDYQTPTQEGAVHLGTLDFLDTAFVEKFRQPTFYNTLDGEVWRMYSRQANLGDKNVEILIGCILKAPWKMLEIPQSVIVGLDAKLKQEADKVAMNLRTQKAPSRWPRLGLSADGLVIVNSATKHVELWGPWVPGFLPSDTNLPTAGYRPYIHEGELYIVVTDIQGRLLATSLAPIGSVWWLGGLCGVAFLCMSILTRTISRRFLRNYFALAGTRVPTLEEALRSGEGQSVEFKRGFPDDSIKSGTVEDDLMRSIAAFANTNDGAAFIGIDDVGHVKGLELDFQQRDRLERRIRQLVRSRIKPTPPIQLTFEDVRDLTVAKITVARGEAPVYMIGGVIYLRYGSADVQAQPEDLRRLVAEFAF
jgi:hypothetical protein